jgi:starch synthase
MTAIFFHREAYTIQTDRLMGRHAAGHGFLRAWLRYCSQPRYEALLADQRQIEAFKAAVKAFGRDQASDLFDWSAAKALRRAGSLVFPGPGIAAFAWYRRAMQFKEGGERGSSSRAFSLIGITHTTASAAAMDQICQWLTAPVEPWDAVICTSEAVKHTLRLVLEQESEYLRERLSAHRFTLPHLPVIPLGVHPEDFEFTNHDKVVARQKLLSGVAQSADQRWTIVLFTGRLSFHAKAHPLAMYQALQRALIQANGGANKTAQQEKILLIECGWHANEFIEKAFDEAARWAMPDIAVLKIDGRNAVMRQTAWAGADVFCSLSDNIQETFGITPIEAMAASLPVVVSDWNGYKDTVRHGIDGFRIPTLMPGVGSGADLALRHAMELDTYDMYCGHTSQSIAIDVNAAAQALAKLVVDHQLRQSMGKAGQAHARSRFAWQRIIAQYEALFEDLRLERACYPSLRPSVSASDVYNGPWPARLDPFYSFGHYASERLEQSTLLLAVKPSSDSRELLKQYQSLAMVNYARAGLPSQDVLDALLEGVASAEAGVSVQILFRQVMEKLKLTADASWYRAIVWLIKMNLVRFPVPDQTA